ncbi:hypothetical protein MMC13_007119 [Lambiella insularis]|nr:hypothetical protein [Lambiella insularis]
MAGKLPPGWDVPGIVSSLNRGYEQAEALVWKSYRTSSNTYTSPYAPQNPQDTRTSPDLGSGNTNVQDGPSGQGDNGGSADRRRQERSDEDEDQHGHEDNARLDQEERFCTEAPLADDLIEAHDSESDAELPEAFEVKDEFDSLCNEAENKFDLMCNEGELGRWTTPDVRTVESGVSDKAPIRAAGVPAEDLAAQAQGLARQEQPEQFSVPAEPGLPEVVSDEDKKRRERKKALEIAKAEWERRRQEEEDAVIEIPLSYEAVPPYQRASETDEVIQNDDFFPRREKITDGMECRPFHWRRTPTPPTLTNEGPANIPERLEESNIGFDQGSHEPPA